jgi:uncharacterized peroxidase-related enzyme
MRLDKVRTGHSLKHWLMLKLAPLVTGAPAPDLVRVLFYRREFFGGPVGPFQQAVLRGPSDWTIGERELFATFVSAKNSCRFCVDVHSTIAGRLVGHKVVDALLADLDDAPVSDKAKCMLRFLEKLTLDPERVCPEDVEPLRAAGIRDEAIVDAIYVCMIFCLFNRLVDAFGCSPLTAKQLDASATMLLKGYD